MPSHSPSLGPSLHPVGASPAGSPCSSLPFATPSSHDAVSPGSTPQSVSAHHVRGRGRPRKALIPPSYDDKPENVSKEELLKWKKRKNKGRHQFTHTLKNLHVQEQRKRAEQGNYLPYT